MWSCFPSVTHFHESTIGVITWTIACSMVYLPDLPAWVTIAFWTSLPLASLSAVQALVSGFCPSGYDFAIASSLPHLAM